MTEDIELTLPIQAMITREIEMLTSILLQAMITREMLTAILSAVRTEAE